MTLPPLWNEPAVWGALFLHFATLSMLAVGGAMTTASDMQRFLVDQRGWLDAPQFTASIALAQAAPGPNVLFVAVLGWNTAGPMGVVATMAGTLLPSALLTLGVTRRLERHAHSRGVRAFNTGLAPLTVALVAASGVVLAQPAWVAALHGRAGALALVAVSALGLASRRMGPLPLVALGAVAGALGLA